MLSSILIAIVMVAGGERQGVPPPTFDGEWVGTYSTGEGGGSLEIKVGRDGGAPTVAVRATSPYVAEPRFLPASDVRIDGDTLAFTLYWGSDVRWKGTLGKDAVSGEMVAEHWSGTWRATRKVVDTPFPAG